MASDPKKDPAFQRMMKELEEGARQGLPVAPSKDSDQVAAKILADFRMDFFWGHAFCPDIYEPEEVMEAYKRYTEFRDSAQGQGVLRNDPYFCTRVDAGIIPAAASLKREFKHRRSV